jgi:F-type H+-transporting ATPase subunit a
MPTSATADLSFNLAMALIAVFYTQHQGIQAHADAAMHKGMNPVGAWGVGFFKHMSHFTGPKLGGPLILISVMIFFVEIISELMKNVSLSLRLFGNIHGGHEAVEAMNQVGLKMGGIEWLNIPFGYFLIPVKLLTCVVQALIFCLLTCVYISLVTHHEDDHGDDHSHAGHDAVPALTH